MENGRPADIKPGTDLEANPGHDGEGRTERVPAALRHARIIASFGNNDFVSITSLADELGVSGMTVRRDLDLLGKRGLLERTHGGAVAAGPLAAATFDEDEPPFEQRVRLQAVENLRSPQRRRNWSSRANPLALMSGPPFWHLQAPWRRAGICVCSPTICASAC